MFRAADWHLLAVDGERQQFEATSAGGIHPWPWSHEPRRRDGSVHHQRVVRRSIGYAGKAALTTTGHGGVLPLHRDVEQRSTCGTPLYCSREPNARLDVVPPLSGADGLVADVGIDLPSELRIAQALRHDGRCSVVEPLGRGQASQLCGVAGKALAQDAPQLGR